MNPCVFVSALLKKHKYTNLCFILIVAFSIGLGVALSSQENAFRSATSHSSDKFDLLIAPSGSKIDLLLNVIFLKFSPLELLESSKWISLLDEKNVEFVAPLVFGDSFNKYPVVGTIPSFIQHLANGDIDGSVPVSTYDIVIGNKVDLSLGEIIEITHGHGVFVVGEAHSGHKFQVVGRLPYLGTPWDKSIISTVESVWRIHGLPDGHHPDKRSLNLVGPPFDAEYLPDVTALVVKPSSISSAYKIRSRYQTQSTMAFFPAEVLVELYAYLGNIMVVIGSNLVATQFIVVLAISSGIFLLVQQFRKKFAVFRALGASKKYIFSVIWYYTFILICTGGILGLVVGYILAQALAKYFELKEGVSIESTISSNEYFFAAMTMLIGLLAVIVPACKVYKDDIIENLK